MRHLNLSSYNVTLRQVVENEGPQDVETPYQIRKSLIMLLFAQQGLGAVDLLDRDDLARAIRDNPTEELRLEEADYDKLVKAVKDFHGYNQNDVELVRRVLDAKKVPVTQ